LSEFHEKVGTILQAEDYPKQELGILITPIELGRACFIEYLIFADGSEKEKVEKLYLEIYKQVVDLGGNVDRPYGPVAGMVYAKNPVHSNFLKYVRDQFDPKGIMNPNRLIT